MKHGTVAMYRRELRVGEEPCEACRAAQATYIAGQRLLKPRDRKAETRQATIKRRALTRLAQEYPDRMAALLEEESSRA